MEAILNELELCEGTNSINWNVVKDQQNGSIDFRSQSRNWSPVEAPSKIQIGKIDPL